MTRQGRILVVDDEASWRSILTDALQAGGFRVDAADSIQEAEQFLSQHFYHLGVFDLRLTPGDETKQGMQLLETLEPSVGTSMKIIMLSAFGDDKNVRDAFKRHVSDFIRKADYEDELFIAQVKGLFANEIQINLDLEMHWKQVAEPKELLVNLEVDGRRIKREDPSLDLLTAELDDLLCRLFFDAKSLLVKPFNRGLGGSGILWVKPFYASGAGQERVVKFGDVLKIEREYRNYQNHVQKFIGGGRTTSIPNHGLRRTQRLGGIIYSLLGSSGEQTESFGTFYLRSDLEDIKRVMDGLFLETCKGWYRNPGEQRLVDLTREYEERLNFTPEKLAKALTEGLRSVQGKQKLQFNNLADDRRFTNPLQAMSDFQFEETTYLCNTHGDLNENNVLVDQEGHTWLIDFDKSGLGHILRDVAELDSVIRFQLLGSEEATLDERLQMEEALCSLKNFHEVDELPKRFRTDNDQLSKAFLSIVHLRSIGRKLILQNDAIEEYYIALFYYAVNTIRFLQVPTLQRQHALLSASLLADRLG